jgi:regulatory protein
MEKVITKIEIQKRNKDRVNVFINGEFAFACSSELVYTHGLKQDKKVDMESLQEVVAEDNYLKCKNSALKIMERGYKTEKEMYDKLILKGYEEKTIARTMEFLKSYNMLNDEAYSRLYIKDKVKSQGKNKIKNDLLRKGIHKELLEEKLSEIDSASEYNTAFKMAEKKYAVIIKTEKDYRKIGKKLWDYLMRSGYSGDIIEDIIRKLVVKEEIEIKEEESTSLEEIFEIAKRRHDIIIKSENDEKKLYKKLSDFLLRRGYSYEDIKSVLKELLKS